MADFYYQIKGKDASGNWHWPPLHSGLIFAETRKDARDKIEGVSGNATHDGIKRRKGQRAALELLMLHRLETPLLVVTDPTHPIGTEIDTIKIPEKQSGMITLRASDVRTYIPEIPKQPLTSNYITKNKSIRGGSPREWGEQKYKKSRKRKK
jgi:hypothetical protein